MTRPLTDLPVAGYPLVLRVAVPRYRCVTGDCGRVVFCQDLGKLAAPRSATTRRCSRYVLRRLMIDRTTILAIAAELGVSWHTVNTIAMRATADLVAAAGPDRLAGVKVIGIDEHHWAPRRFGADGFVTVIIDLTHVGVDVGGDLGLQRRREHRLGTVTHDLVEQRPARRAVLVGPIRIVDYREHGRTLPNQRADAGVAGDCVPEPALTDNGKVFTGPVPPSASGGAFGGLP